MSPPASPPTPGAGPIGDGLRATHRLLQRALQRRLARHGVTLGMWQFLRALWEQDGLAQSELSRRTGTVGPTALSAVSAMEAAGLVRRAPHATDRRKVAVRLTRRGRALRAVLLPEADAVLGRALRPLSPEERALLPRLLEAMRAALEADEAGGPASDEDGAAPGGGSAADRDGAGGAAAVAAPDDEGSGATATATPGADAGAMADARTGVTPPARAGAATGGTAAAPAEAAPDAERAGAGDDGHTG